MSGHDALGRDENHERKQKGNSPHHNESLYLVLLNSIPALVAAKDRDGRFVFVSNEYASLFGKSPDDLVGKSVADFYPKEFAQDARMEDERLMRIGQVLEDVFEDTVSGKRKYFASRKGPVRNEQGEVVGVQTIFWDVTKRRTAELALLAEREELRATKQATEEAIRAINAFLETARQTLDELPATLRKACECLESQLNKGSE